MKTKLALFTVLFAAGLFFVSSQPVEAVEVWQARYYNNRLLWGEPILVRNESGLNHDWGDGSPDEVVYTDNFSAEWITTTFFEEGLLRWRELDQTAHFSKSLSLYTCSFVSFVTL